MAYFRSPEPGQAVRAVPGAGLEVPVWILGSSLFGAQLAAALSLPYAFASHFAPTQMMQAVEIYRRMFRPSEQMEKSHVMLGINVFAADTEQEARRLMTSVQQSWVQLRRGNPIRLPPPIEGYESRLTAVEMATLEHALACSVVGSPEMVRRGLEEFAERTGADELMVVSQVYDHAARLRSYEIAAGR